jgi:1-acyl-sn-glycerol-3-phosphate acyltransferase
MGWKVINAIPPEVKKCVVMMAPHTSNFDFFLGWIGYGTLKINSKYLIKKEAFFFPFAGLLRAMGGIPVNRRSSTNIVHQVGEMFKKEEELIITITPEGTRSLNYNWKRGFYYIAVNAGVPIALGFLDYKEKLGGIGQMLYPTGNYDEDIKIIEAFYSDKHARHPEKFNLSPANRK